MRHMSGWFSECLFFLFKISCFLNQQNCCWFSWGVWLVFGCCLLVFYLFLGALGLFKVMNINVGLALL